MLQHPDTASLGVLQAVDRDDRPVLLFESNWELQYAERENPKARFLVTENEKMKDSVDKTIEICPAPAASDEVCVVVEH